MTQATERAVYVAGVAAGASDKAMLAAFETIIVESGARNLASRKVPESLRYPNEGVAAGDHDSVGAFQQRASWGSVASRMNVGESAARFFAKAKAKEKATGQTAGQLAQAVQVSAFPLKYDAVEGRARVMLASARAGSGATPATITPVGLGGVGDAVNTITDPNTWVRVGLYVTGFLLILIGAISLVGTQVLGGKAKMIANVARVVSKK